MIPEAAVEAAAKALFVMFGPRSATLEDLNTEDKAEELAAARVILEAAAPHLMAGVKALADAWESRGEYDMAFSKTIPDEDIAMELLTGGAQKVENARHIRNAIGATK